MKDRALTAPEWLARSAVYQINPRTFSAEGTLNAVTREIPALHAMGFRVLYLCPIFEADTSDDIAFWSDRQRKSQTMNPRVYLKSQKEEKDENNVEKKWYNKCRRK